MDLQLTCCFAMFQWFGGYGCFIGLSSDSSIQCLNVIIYTVGSKRDQNRCHHNKIN